MPVGVLTRCPVGADRQVNDLLAHGQIALGKIEAERKGTNRKLVRTDPRLAQTGAHAPPYELYSGQHSLLDVKAPPLCAQPGRSPATPALSFARRGGGTVCATELEGRCHMVSNITLCLTVAHGVCTRGLTAARSVPQAASAARLLARQGGRADA